MRKRWWLVTLMSLIIIAFISWQIYNAHQERLWQRERDGIIETHGDLLDLFIQVGENGFPEEELHELIYLLSEATLDFEVIVAVYGIALGENTAYANELMSILRQRFPDILLEKATDFSWGNSDLSEDLLADFLRRAQLISFLSELQPRRRNLRPELFDFTSFAQGLIQDGVLVYRGDDFRASSLSIMLGRNSLIFMPGTIGYFSNVESQLILELIGHGIIHEGVVFIQTVNCLQVLGIISTPRIYVNIGGLMMPPHNFTAEQIADMMLTREGHRELNRILTRANWHSDTTYALTDIFVSNFDDIVANIGTDFNITVETPIGEWPQEVFAEVLSLIEVNRHE